MAAAAIYMASQASDQKKTQKGLHTNYCYLIIIIYNFSHITEVGDVVGVADSTIRQSYRLMYPHRAKLFPKDFKFVVAIDDLPKH